MNEEWLTTHPCPRCGEPTPGPYALCAFCATDEDADTYADTYDPADWGEWDTDEELPCLHADGCPGHRRCLVCI